MHIHHALASEPTPHYLRHVGMRWARFIEDGDKPGTGTASAEEPPTSAEGEGGEKPAGKTTEEPETGAGGEGEQSVEGLKSALATERSSAKQYRKELADAKAALQKIEDAKLSDIQRANKDRDAALAERDEARAALAIRDLATEHGITDKADIELLASIKDEDKRAAAAARLAPSEEKKQEPGSRKGSDPVPESGTGGNSPRTAGDSAKSSYERWKAKNTKN